MPSEPSKNASAKPWWKNGLKFKCNQCGNCCTGAPGVVTVSKNELGPLAKIMNITKKEFLGLFTTTENSEIQLREKRNYDCIFWEKRKGCLVYPVRPVQCKTWPFWKRMLSSKKAWNEEAKNCPGMNSGTHYTAEDIKNMLKSRNFAEDNCK